MSKQHQRIAVIVAVLVAATWWLATSPDSPVRPDETPRRPVIALLGRMARVAARIGLTAMWFAEPQSADADEIQTVRATLGADGHQLLDNARW